MVDEELRARIISRAKVKLGKMKDLSILEAVTLLEYIEELESHPTQRAIDAGDSATSQTVPNAGAVIKSDGSAVPTQRN